MKYSAFRSHVFQAQVEKALTSVKRILDSNREPKLAEEVQEHQYDDKYALAEFLTNTAVAAQWNILERMGVTTEMMEDLHEHIRDKRSLTLRFEAEDTCEFLKEANVDVVTHEERIETETTKGRPGSILSRTRKGSSKYKVVKKVVEYHWTVGMKYMLFIYAGTDPKKDPLVLQTRSSSTVVTMTGTKKSVVPSKTRHNPMEVNITWLVQQTMSNDGNKGKTDTGGTMCSFRIDRMTEDCKTPVRNDDIQKALGFHRSFQQWSKMCINHFKLQIEQRILCHHAPANPESITKHAGLAAVSAGDLFCPIVPLLEDPENREVAGTATRQETPKSVLVLPASGPSGSSHLLSLGDIDKFLNEQIRSLVDALGGLSQTFAPQDQVKLITIQEATLTLLWMSSMELSSHYEQSVYYIERMLRKQLIAAIGKEVQPKDFDQYMSHHMAKLFGPSYHPTPFCYSIRRPNQYPDGILSIELANDASSKDTTPPPVQTMVRHIEGTSSPPLEIPISAATKVIMTGDRFLHGWIRHRFESSGSESFHLAARARQFSSFLLMVGVMGSANEFHPKNAIILQNKDEVLIPLLLNELPTAKDFKDAISSLSPEQQRFAKSFRSMQLESSVFGVCIVQLKPQLEALLGLPSGALNKEIRLTQDLMSLFVDYQIPSDLLSYDGDVGATLSEKVNAVKRHVKAVLEVIDDSKKTQLKEAEQEAEMAFATKACSFDDVMEAGFCSATEVTFLAKSSGVRREKRRGPLSTRKKSAIARSPSRNLDLAMSAHSEPVASLSDLADECFEEHSLASDPSEAAVSSVPKPSENDTTKAVEGAAPIATNDFTMIPKVLDSKFEKHDADNSLRATIIETSQPWSRKRQENLLTKMKTKILPEDDVKMEKNKAFDLLDALSRSGSLEISCAELHVVVAATHCFENDVMGTVIQDNVNPIEKVERSALMIATTIHGRNAVEMIKDESEKGRLALAFPALVAQPVDLLT